MTETAVQPDQLDTQPLNPRLLAGPPIATASAGVEAPVPGSGGYSHAATETRTLDLSGTRGKTNPRLIDELMKTKAFASLDFDSQQAMISVFSVYAPVLLREIVRRMSDEAAAPALFAPGPSGASLFERLVAAAATEWQSRPFVGEAPAPPSSGAVIEAVDTIDSNLSTGFLDWSVSATEIDESLQLLAELDSTSRRAALALMSNDSGSLLLEGAASRSDLPELGAELTARFGTRAAGVAVETELTESASAAAVVEAMLSHRPDIAERLAQGGGRVVSYPPALAQVSGLPEFSRTFFDPGHRGARASLTRAAAAYPSGNMVGLSHELAHMIHFHGLSSDERDRIDAICERLRKAQGDPIIGSQYSATPYLPFDTSWEFFAIASVLYFYGDSANVGGDRLTREWMLGTDAEFEALLIEIYGPHPSPLPANIDPEEAIGATGYSDDSGNALAMWMLLLRLL